MSKKDEQSGVSFDSIALAIKEHKKEAMTAPEMPLPWKLIEKQTTVTGDQMTPPRSPFSSRTTIKLFYEVPIKEARELLADRERLKKVEESVREFIEWIDDARTTEFGYAKEGNVEILKEYYLDRGIVMQQCEEELRDILKKHGIELDGEE